MSTVYLVCGLYLCIFLCLYLDLAEKLFKHVEGLHEKFEVKLLYLNLVSRLVGVHEVSLFIIYLYTRCKYL